MSDTPKTTAFITGATGMVGNHLAARLAAEGQRLRCLVRANSDTALLKHLGAELVPGDVTDRPDMLRELIVGCQVIYHCAGLVDDWASREEMTRVNVDGTRHMLEAATDLKGLRRFVMIGSMVVYGMGPQNNIDETAPFVHTGDNYNETKIAAAEQVFRYAREGGVPVVLCTPPYIYGERDRQFFPRLFESLRDGVFKFIGDGNRPITLAYVANVVRALTLAAQAEHLPHGDHFLITDGESITRRELAQMICQEMGYKMPTACVPIPVANAVRPVVEFIAKVRHTRPILNRFKMKFMATPMTFNITKARKHLGYEPVEPPRESLRKTIRWFREHHQEMLPKTSQAKT